jgi:hypothetical protein
LNEPVLNNEDQFPTEEIIFYHIGKTKTIWEELFNHISNNHPDFSKEWRLFIGFLREVDDGH